MGIDIATLVGQARQAYANVARTLDKLGAGMGDIVDEIFFVTDVGAAMENIEALWAVRAEAYGGDPQVSQTTLQVSGLVMPASSWSRITARYESGRSVR